MLHSLNRFSCSISSVPGTVLGAPAQQPTVPLGMLCALSCQHSWHDVSLVPGGRAPCVPHTPLGWEVYTEQLSWLLLLLPLAGFSASLLFVFLKRSPTPVISKGLNFWPSSSRPDAFLSLTPPFLAFPVLLQPGLGHTGIWEGRRRIWEANIKSECVTSATCTLGA